ncbi:protein TolQ [Wenzhouxiangella sp. XN79A]|uniref:protein TolQ n=1 Tax=Wenzhouxiangella sp. XN79A TaxID=2724193 RepID=UPI00144A7C1B|nr:protein TolQ [Wenzhouxiangella sp. XN79A]NKI35504.1 protein TolQ [Wenzhouxiangella sp. XN79A]
MSTDMNVWSLILEATLVVQLVMALLLAASVVSWMIIFAKRTMLRRVDKRSKEFEDKFWSGADLGQLYDRIASEKKVNEGLETIFEAGFREFTRLREEKRVSPDTLAEGAQRAMRVALTREVDRMEHRLDFLATVGSTSPYVGLFGTVWGIMHAFFALAGVQQATIAMVAPGIAEALIATAMGLVAAIPAVIAYNRFSNQVYRLEVRMDNFKEEFAGILHRQARRLQEG